jgi:hypothetical protein
MTLPKVVVPMLMVPMPSYQIVTAANLLVGNFCVPEHNAYIGLRYD